MDASTHTPGPVRDKRDPLRPLRYAYRIPLLLVHVLLGIALCGIVLTLFGGKVMHKGREPFAHRTIRWWSTGLLRIFGFRARRIGTPLNDPTLFVCNHSSWLDIELMHTQRAACFVAKAEIARWPVVGWMAARGGTIFHRRGSNHSLAAVMQVMVDRMRGGRSVAVFPEGGTSSGADLRVFHARILQAAIDAESPIQPVALRYARGGKRWLDVAFRPRESFLSNVIRLMGEPTLDAEVHFLKPVPVHPDGRKRMAEQARAQIAQALEDPA
ncbi:lysophospholipid acyltransferase family protein [Oleiagrimonas sp. C23AA]|uniref:lysophospholipid acyltransferase family protein n=1 Tax=Oleiagrimonas sp. C23AA TaxID=2719047 RepID=UPI00141F668A|nr:lysophospholipid acyltransferase family protein [Oleiagrimonas sp. C23AA]NII10632.1 1-acyl-sn-glycerol-3-phosphate acyltransferase [Oleiagrimonas sp. C23AA]